MINKYMDFLKSDAFLSPLGIPDGTGLEFSVLGQGEYNLNYVFTHPVTGSAMNSMPCNVLPPVAGRRSLCAAGRKRICW